MFRQVVVTTIRAPVRTLRIAHVTDGAHPLTTKNRVQSVDSFRAGVIPFPGSARHRLHVTSKPNVLAGVNPIREESRFLDDWSYRVARCSAVCLDGHMNYDDLAQSIRAEIEWQYGCPGRDRDTVRFSTFAVASAVAQYFSDDPSFNRTRFLTLAVPDYGNPADALKACTGATAVTYTVDGHTYDSVPHVPRDPYNRPGNDSVPYQP